MKINFFLNIHKTVSYFKFQFTILKSLNILGFIYCIPINLQIPKTEEPTMKTSKANERFGWFNNFYKGFNSEYFRGSLQFDKAPKILGKSFKKILEGSESSQKF